MPQRFWVLLLGSVVGAASPASGQPTGPALTLEQCVDIALRENPRVHAAAELVLAAQARINLAKALPQPVVSFDSDCSPDHSSFTSRVNRIWG